MNCDTLLVLDTIEDRLISQSLELLGFAAACGEFDSSRTLLLLTGENVTATAAKLAQQYGLTVIVCEHDHFYYPNPELLRAFLLDTVTELKPKFVCFHHTMRNCQVTSALGVTLEAASVTAVESCDTCGGSPVFRRRVVSGKFLQSVRSTTPCTIVTVMPGAFMAPEIRSTGAAPPSLLHRSLQTTCSNYLPTGIAQCSDSDTALDDADVVVAAGRGIGTEQNLSLVRDFAGIFSDAAIGASRPLCDLKWLPHPRQVGVSGRSIAPRLYVACGISGAQQHLAGIRGAECVVAINADPDAAIFSVADYIIIDDLHAFLPLVLKKHRERFGHE